MRSRAPRVPFSRRSAPRVEVALCILAEFQILVAECGEGTHPPTSHTRLGGAGPLAARGGLPVLARHVAWHVLLDYVTLCKAESADLTLGKRLERKRLASVSDKACQRILQIPHWRICPCVD